MRDTLLPGGMPVTLASLSHLSWRSLLRWRSPYVFKSLVCAGILLLLARPLPSPSLLRRSSTSDFPQLPGTCSSESRVFVARRTFGCFKTSSSYAPSASNRLLFVSALVSSTDQPQAVTHPVTPWFVTDALTHGAFAAYVLWGVWQPFACLWARNWPKALFSTATLLLPSLLHETWRSG